MAEQDEFDPASAYMAMQALGIGYIDTIRATPRDCENAYREIHVRPRDRNKRWTDIADEDGVRIVRITISVVEA